MYVEKLAIKNFRCFAETEFELNYPGRAATSERSVQPRLDNVNLFLGDNGSGKSSVFKALALGILAPILRSSGFKAEYLVRRNPDEITKSQQIQEFLIRDRAEISYELLIHNHDLGQLKTEASHLTGITYLDRIGDVEDISNTTIYKSSIDEMFVDSSPAFFIVGYGASRRSERPEGYSESSRGPRYQRVASIFEEHVGMVPFSFGYLQLQQSGYFDEARAILNNLLLGDVTLINAADNQNRPLFEQNGVYLPFNALSDGYRTFLGWVWDILFQISRIAPRIAKREHLKLTEISGVVIVDEIDLFLHPEWQRVVIEQVAIMFPKLQFLFSSHSPLVAGALEPANIYVVDGETVEQYREDIYGLTANQVLTSSYFGLRSTRAPNTGTLSNLAQQMLGQNGLDTTDEEAEPKDRVLVAQESAWRMLEEIGDE